MSGSTEVAEEKPAAVNATDSTEAETASVQEASGVSSTDSETSDGLVGRIRSFIGL